MIVSAPRIPRLGSSSRLQSTSTAEDGDDDDDDEEEEEEEIDEDEDVAAAVAGGGGARGKGRKIHPVRAERTIRPSASGSRLSRRKSTNKKARRQKK